MPCATSAADWITALATAGAAVGTVGATVFAAKAAKAASHSAETANDANRAASRPLLLDVPYEHYTDYEHEYPWPGESMRKTAMRGQIVIDNTFGTFAVPVRNVGRGVARVESVAIRIVEIDRVATITSGIAIPVGEDDWLAGRPEDTDFTAALGRVPSPTHGALPWEFTVTYTDIAGQERQRLRLGVGTVGADSALRVLEITHLSE